MKTYTELCQYATFEDRFHYLQLHGTVGYDTFGFDRWLNQSFYQSREWRQFRDRIIVRDAGCDLACKDHEITDWVIRNGKPIRPRIIIHHLNPLTPAHGGNDMYPVRKFNVAEAAYSTNLRLKMQETERMVRCIAPSRERSLALTKLDEALFWANAAIAAEGVMDHEE